MKKGLIFRLLCLALAALTVFSSAGCSLFRKDEETKRAPLTVISSIGASEAKGNINAAKDKYPLCALVQLADGFASSLMEDSVK